MRIADFGGPCAYIVVLFPAEPYYRSHFTGETSENALVDNSHDIVFLITCFCHCANIWKINLFNPLPVIFAFICVILRR